MTEGKAAAPTALDPFLLPSPTGYRFVLLVATVIAVTCIVYVMLHNSVPSNWERRQARVATCQQLPNPVRPDGVQDGGAGGLLRDRCMASANRAQAVWPLAGVALLVAVTFALYWTAPGRKLRRNRLEPLSSDDAPEVVAATRELCQRAGLTSAPSFVWQPTNSAVSGVAFGRHGRYYVALTGGLVGLFHGDRPGFRAIVLHELAHLRNRDIDRTYLTVASWQAFLLVALAPFVVSRLFLPAEHLWSFAWRLAALTLLVLTTRNEVLRTREYYADLRAAIWEGESGPLRRTLDKVGRRVRGWRLARLFDFHPTGAERQEIMADPTRLMRPQLALALAAGVTAAIAVREGAPLFQAFLIVRSSGWFDLIDPGTLLVCLVLGGLAALVVGAELWEAELLAAHRGERPSSGTRLGVGLGLGVIVGFWLGLTSAVTAEALPTGWMGVVCWVVVVVLVCVVLTRGFADAVHGWLTLGGRRELLGRVWRWSLVVYAALLALWLAALAFAQFTIMSTRSANTATLSGLGYGAEIGALAPFVPLLGAVFVLVAGAAPTLTMLALATAPFAVRLGTVRAGHSGQAIVTTSSTLSADSIRPGHALLVGMVTGLVALLVMTAAMFVGVPGAGIAALFALGVGSVAAIVSRRTQLMGWLRSATFGVGAGAIGWGVFAALKTPSAETFLNLVAWLAVLVGLLATRRAGRPPASA